MFLRTHYTTHKKVEEIRSKSFVSTDFPLKTPVAPYPAVSVECGVVNCHKQLRLGWRLQRHHWDVVMVRKKKLVERRDLEKEPIPGFSSREYPGFSPVER